jgi:hypothetical protein
MQDSPVTSVQATFVWGPVLLLGIGLLLFMFLVLRLLRPNWRLPVVIVSTALLLAVVNFFTLRRSVVVPPPPEVVQSGLSSQDWQRLLNSAGSSQTEGPQTVPQSTSEGGEPLFATRPDNPSPDSVANPGTGSAKFQDPGVSPQTSEPTEERPDRRKQLAEFAGRLGQLVRSQLESPATASPATNPAASSAGESANGDVVVFQLSEEMLRQLLGDSATEMLQTFNAQLPGGIRQTYALIPLSSPVGATVPQVQPLLAASGLSTLADSLVSLLMNDDAGQSTTTAENNTASAPKDTTPAAEEPLPEWVNTPRPDQMVAQTSPQFSGADEKAALNTAVSNTALKFVLLKHAGKLPEVQNGAWDSQLQLSASLAEQCIASRYVRSESLDTGVEGQKSFRVHYALVEVPAAVEQKILAAITSELRTGRAVVLTAVVAGLWLTITITAAGLRCVTATVRSRRRLGWPLLTLSLPMALMLLIALTTLLSGRTPRPQSPLVSWAHGPAQLTVNE